jgi:D-glycero-alpha-D-manno-heptose 1-phosphate guanylyltransferase
MEILEAIVLVGGKGTRLQSVVSDRPKPMAPVLGRPFLEWIIISLKRQGIKHIVLAIGYKGGLVREYFGDGSEWGVEIDYSQEVVPLGTGGAARLAIRMVKGEQVFVLNGDSLCGYNLQSLCRTYQQFQTDATIWLVQMEDCRRYGSVEIDEDGRVIAFREKDIQIGSGLVNVGVYLFLRHSLEELPLHKNISLETQFFQQLLNHNIYAVVGPPPFIDIGTPESYANAESFVEGFSYQFSD